MHMITIELQLWIVGFFVVMNTFSFLLMAWDKLRSRKSGAERISEGMLFFMATIFGSVGVYLGMFTLRHKNRKWYFVIGIPLIICQNCALLYVIFKCVEHYF